MKLSLKNYSSVPKIHFFNPIIINQLLLSLNLLKLLFFLRKALKFVTKRRPKTDNYFVKKVDEDFSMKKQSKSSQRLWNVLQLSPITTTKQVLESKFSVDFGYCRSKETLVISIIYSITEQHHQQPIISYQPRVNL